MAVRKPFSRLGFGGKIVRLFAGSPRAVGPEMAPRKAASKDWSPLVWT